MKEKKRKKKKFKVASTYCRSTSDLQRGDIVGGTALELAEHTSGTESLDGLMLGVNSDKAEQFGKSACCHPVCM